MRVCTSVLALAAAATSWASQLPLNAPSWSSHAPANTTRPKVLTPEFSKFVEEVMNGTVPGLTLGIVHPGGEVEFGAWGRKTEDGDEMTVDTLFTFASCSKAFLAASVGILMDDFTYGRNNTPLPPGVTRFDWYTKVKDILPGEWGLVDEWATEKATFRDILSHQSGVPRHDLSYAPSDSPADAVRKLRYLRPAFELRQRWHYNNMMYVLGSYVISKYSGMPYTEFAKERIFAPLNMSSSTFLASEASREGKLTQTWSKQGRRIPVWISDEKADLIAGAGGVISSVVDMVHWVKMLLNEGVDPSTNATVVPKDAFETTTTSHMLITSRGLDADLSAWAYGMGWIRFAYQGHEIVYHDGGVPGISTQVFFLPWDDFGLVVLANADEKQLHEQLLVYRILEDYFGLKHMRSEKLRERVREQTEPGSTASKNWMSALGVGLEAENQELQRATVAACTSPTPAALPLTSPLPLEAYAGTYTDPGYGSITLCAPTSTPLVCQLALEDFAHFENVTREGGDTLYGVLDSFWVSHARLRRKHDVTVAGEESGNVFAVSGTWLFPHGYGKDTSPFETSETGQSEVVAEFVVEGGRVVGMSLTGFVGEMTELERQGGGIKETAEVWLVKATY